MGQKVHPYGFRIGTLYGWQSNWFAEKNYAAQLHEDVKIRAFIKKKLYHAGISKVVIERTGEKIVINIHTARRVAFRRAMKKAMIATMKFGAEGIRIQCSGRLGGAEMGRREWYRDGRVPLHTLRAEIEYGFAEARTTYGVVGVKCWIFKGEVGDRELKRGPLSQDHRSEAPR